MVNNWFKFHFFILLPISFSFNFDSDCAAHLEPLTSTSSSRTTYHFQESKTSAMIGQIGPNDIYYKLGLCLVKATRTANLDDVKKLINYRVYVDTPDDQGITALFYATCKGNIEIVRLLIQAGANVNSKGIDGIPPLMCAIVRQHYEIVKLLVKSGADVNSSSDKGWTPLMDAVFANYIDTIKLLIENCSDVTRIDNNGKKPIYYARSSEATEILEKEESRVNNLIAQRHKNIVILLNEKNILPVLSYIIADYAFSAYGELIEAQKIISKKKPIVKKNLDKFFLM